MLEPKSEVNHNKRACTYTGSSLEQDENEVKIVYCCWQSSLPSNRDGLSRSKPKSGFDPKSGFFPAHTHPKIWPNYSLIHPFSSDMAQNWTQT